MTDLSTAAKNWEQLGLMVTPTWQKRRQAALHNSAGLTWPTRKSESWKYTSTKPIQDAQFSLPAQDQLNEELKASVKAELISGVDHLVFINGYLNKELSQLPQNCVVSSPSSENDDVGFSSNFLSAMNLVLSVDPMAMTFGKSLERPLQILYYQSLGDGPSVMVHPHLSLTFKDGVRAQILETFLGQRQARYFFNSQTVVSIGKRSQIEWVSLQDQSLQSFHLQMTSFNVDQDGELRHFSSHTGASLSRQELKVNLNKPQAKTQILAANVIKGQQHHDDNTFIDHASGETQSAQIYKNLLDENARGVFDGKIHIAHQSQKSAAQQLNKNLLLSSKAEIDAKPQLNIFADDVTATHGSTTGQIDAEELFYLQSRAIDASTAQQMLALGFVSDLVDQVETPVLQKQASLFLDRAFRRAVVKPIRNLKDSDSV